MAKNRDKADDLVAAAFLFFNVENNLEREDLNETCKQAREVNRSIDFIVNHLTEIHYDEYKV